MKLWIDDVRPAPEGYVWTKCVDAARVKIRIAENMGWKIEVIDLDHDAGELAERGGDYIKLLDWLQETGRNYPIHIHSQNVVGRMNMEAICRRNGWTILP